MSNNGHAGLLSSHRIYQNNVNEWGLYACCIFGGNQTLEKGPPLISDNILSPQDRPWFWRQKGGVMLVSSIQPRYGPWLLAGTGEPDPRSNKRSQYCCCCCGALSLSTLLTAYQGSVSSAHITPGTCSCRVNLALFKYLSSAYLFCSFDYVGVRKKLLILHEEVQQLDIPISYCRG